MRRLGVVRVLLLFSLEYDNTRYPFALCHGSAGTPLGTHANGEAQGLEAACTATHVIGDHVTTYG
jgi:hypothetical protein